MKKIKFLLTIVFITPINCSFSQNADSTIITKKAEVRSTHQPDTIKRNFFVKGAVTITNKGISYIPNLSLGKPAMIFDLSLGTQKIAFEPQLRFALSGEPWSFLFPVRYKINPSGKCQLTAGVIPLLNFKNVTYTINGVPITDLVNRRYLGGELKPGYSITKYINVALQYLYFSGISDRTVQSTHFVAFITNFSNIKLGKKFFARFTPQFYYLWQDGKEGLYFNSVLTLLKRNFPLSIQTNMNTIIETNIPGSEKFMWNVSLIYTINRTYARKAE